MKTKSQLRREIDERRRLLDPEWVAAASSRIIDSLQALDVFQRSGSVSLYKPLAGEVDLDPLFTVCWKMGMQTSMPVFNRAERVYELAGITMRTRFRTGQYGIREPKDFTLESIEAVDLMLVPGVAFDPAGHRLGRGGGYYDRLLKGFSGTAIAVAFDFQVLDQVPFEAHDMSVDGIVTEIKTIEVQNEH